MEAATDNSIVKSKAKAIALSAGIGTGLGAAYAYFYDEKYWKAMLFGGLFFGIISTAVLLRK